MGHLVGPKCRVCRREGLKLFLRGERCESEKCAFSRRDYAPGRTSWRRRKPSEYSLRLREKQKLKRYYGVREEQFRRFFKMAEKGKGNTGTDVLLLLERRLDNVLTQMGFAASRFSARQIVIHGHVCVNGQRVKTPSLLVNAGDVITSRNHEVSKKLIKANLDNRRIEAVPAWLEVDSANLTGRVKLMPTREDIMVPVQEQLVVELCSR